MICWDSEIGSALIVAAIFLSLVGIGELLRGLGVCSQEATRKFVHLTGGVVSLSFAFVFKSHWTVLGLCVAFVTLMVVTKKLGLLPSVHGVKRKSSGDLLHPIAIYLTFVIASHYDKPEFYLISVMVLSVSDALAAIIGVSYGFKVYSVEEEKKSLEGSFVFLLSTFLIVHLGLLLLTHIGRMECVLSALLISILVTCFEAISLGGADNIIIPFGTLFIIMRITTKPVAEILTQLCSIGIIFLTTYGIATPSGRLGHSGIVGVALAGYAAWSLVSPSWYIPVFICTILISTVSLFLEMPGNEDELLRIRPIFYMFIVSFAWIVAANSHLAERQLFFVPYVISFAAMLSIRWKWFQRAGNLVSSRARRLIPQFIANANFVLRAFILTIVFLPINHFVNHIKLNFLFSAVTCFFGIMLTDIIYWGVGNKFHDKWKRVSFLRLAMVAVIVASSLACYAQFYFYKPVV